MKKTLIVLLLLVVTSGLGNLMLYRELSRVYKNMLRIALDPSGQDLYGGANEGLKDVERGRHRVVYFGDSRIFLWEPLPKIPDVDSINRGRKGETTSLALLRQTRDVISLEPDVVVIEMGINDLKAIGVMPENAAQIVDLTQNNIRQIVANLSGHNIKIVLLTIFPPGVIDLPRRAFWSPKINEAINSINQSLEQISMPNVEVLDLDMIFNKNEMMDPDYAHDTLHINQEGYLALNEIVGATVEKLLMDNR